MQEPFKTRWYGHVRDFEVHKENGTELSKYIQELKNSNTRYKINWDNYIALITGEVRNPQRICMNCTYEKMEIANAAKGLY